MHRNSTDKQAPKLHSTARKTIAIYWQEMRKDKKSVIMYTTLIVFQRLINYVVIPLLFSFTIQQLIESPGQWQEPILTLLIALVAVILASYAGNTGIKRQFIHEEHVSTMLMKRAISALMKHSDQFFANKKVGAISGDVTNFSRSNIVFFDALYLNASSIVVGFLASLIIIAILAPILLIPLGFMTTFLVFHTIRSINGRRPLRNERKRRTALLTGTIADILGNHQIVRFFATEKQEITGILNERMKIEAIAGREINIIMRESSIRQVTLFTAQILTMVICIILFQSNLLSIAVLIFTVVYLGRLTSSLFEITPIIRSIEQSLLDAANITEVLELDAEVIDQRGALPIKLSGGAIRFDTVNFSYKDNDDDIVISNFTLDINPGESVGLAGLSGGGKTTLSKLILRFADIQSGSITIDGQDISTVTQESLHTAIAYVPQEAYLFHRSLRENIAYGRPEATDAEIMDAVKRANAFEFIEKLPKGLDTIVGERGVKLSGGQRQRIAIARAILKDAPILVLDEATSALDSLSELLIQKSLTELMKKRTSVVVAHRLSTIAKLDRIIVIDNGQIVEQGTHTELLALGGTYATLWSHQSGGFIQD